MIEAGGVPQDMGVLPGKISQKQLFLENAEPFMHQIMNLLTELGVRAYVMHRCRSWSVFSASLFGVNWMLVFRQYVPDPQPVTAVGL